MSDQRIFSLIHGLAGESGILDFLGVFFAEYLGFFLIVIALVLILFSGGWKKRIHYFSLISLTAIFSRGILTELIRFFYNRPRPFEIMPDVHPLISETVKPSFPSGHMALYFAIALPLFSINKRWGWYFTGASALIGVARIFAGVHWPSDILGGIGVATASFYIVKNFLLKGLKEY